MVISLVDLLIGDVLTERARSAAIRAVPADSLICSIIKVESTARRACHVNTAIAKVSPKESGIILTVKTVCTAPTLRTA